MNVIYVIFLTCFNISITVWAKVSKAQPTKYYQTYSGESAVDTKWIHAPQLDSILMSMEEKLHQISEKQKQDPTASRISNDLEIISHRLQNVEEQIARAESYNKMRLEQLIESTMKSEFLIDQLQRRIEKNQQQIINRLTEMDSLLEKTSKAQENLEKGVRKIEVVQNQVTSSLEELSETMKKVKSETVETLLHVNTTRQHLEKRFNEIVHNITLQKETSELSNATINSQNDVVQTATLPINDLQKMLNEGLDRVVLTIDEKHNIWEEDALLLKTSTEECRSLSNKIYNKLSTEQSDIGDYLGNFLETLTQDIKLENVKNSDKFETALKRNFDLVLKEQHSFRENCHRLQLNEEQMEDKIVTILQNLFDYIDNRTERAQHDLKVLLNFENMHDSNQKNLTEELTSFIKRENDKLENRETNSIFQFSLLKSNLSRLTNDVSTMQNTLYSVYSNLQHIKQFLQIPNKNGTVYFLPQINTYVNASQRSEFESDYPLNMNSGTFVENMNLSITTARTHYVENISSQLPVINNTKSQETSTLINPLVHSKVTDDKAARLKDIFIDDEDLSPENQSSESWENDD